MNDELAPPTFDPADAAAAAARFVASAEPDVSYALLDSPVGTLVAARTERGLACLSYSDHAGGVDAVLDAISTRISPRVLEKPARLDEVARELDEYFEHRRTAFDLDIDWALTSPFAEKVLRATTAIPFGEISTYAQVAAQAGNAKASRAAGNALSANPVPIVVPCHRVLHTGGKGIGNYTGGVHRKEALLRLEGVLLG